MNLAVNKLLCPVVWVLTFPNTQRADWKTEVTHCKTSVLGWGNSSYEKRTNKKSVKCHHELFLLKEVYGPTSFVCWTSIASPFPQSLLPSIPSLSTSPPSFPPSSHSPPHSFFFSFSFSLLSPSFLPFSPFLPPSLSVDEVSYQMGTEEGKNLTFMKHLLCAWHCAGNAYVYYFIKPSQQTT